jgi:hypothetical protein
LKLDSTKFWRGAIIAVPNSFIALLLGISIFLSCAESYQTFLGFFFATISVLIHFCLWCLVGKAPNNISENNLMYLDKFITIFFSYYPLICFVSLLIILSIILISYYQLAIVLGVGFITGSTLTIWVYWYGYGLRFNNK